LKQLEEELNLSPYEREKRREDREEAIFHERSKTAHYAQLGSNFVNRSANSSGATVSPLAGRGRGRR